MQRLVLLEIIKLHNYLRFFSEEDVHAILGYYVTILRVSANISFIGEWSFDATEHSWSRAASIYSSVLNILVLYGTAVFDAYIQVDQIEWHSAP